MSKETVNLPATIPGGFGAIGGVLPEQSRTPYVSFIYAKTNHYSEYLQKIPDLREGEPVLVLPAPELPSVLRPFRYFLLSSQQFWGEYSKVGELLKVSPVKVPNPFKETVEALILVITPKGLVPAQVRFKSTTCPAWASAKRTYDEATTAAWAKKGEDYAFTAQIPQPWARFTTIANRTERTNRETGDRYPTMEAVSNPTTAAELKALVTFFANKDGVATLKEVEKVYIKRLEQAKLKEAKAVAA